MGRISGKGEHGNEKKYEGNNRKSRGEEVARDEGKNNRKMMKANGEKKRKRERKREMKMRGKKGQWEGKITGRI
jgi:hypothetical protein